MKKFELLGKKPTRHGFGEALAEKGETNENLVVLGADITGSVLTSYFRDKFPERFISMGIAEQNATTVAAGLALSGKKPVFASYSAFAAFRNSDQIRISIAYNNANVLIGGGHSGITVGPDGATHQALEEVSFLRALPNMTIVSPCDYAQAKKATKALVDMNGPSYLRFGRSPVPMFTTEDTPFEIGKADVYREGTDVAIIANGLLVWEALLAAEELEKNEGIIARVINLHTIKPIDVKTITDAARECGAIVTAEEHQIYGGMGSAVAEVVVKNALVPMEFVGMPDIFGSSGEPDELLVKYGFTHKEIYASVMKVMESKVNGSKGYRSPVELR